MLLQGNEFFPRNGEKGRKEDKVKKVSNKRENTGSTVSLQALVVKVCGWHGWAFTNFTPGILYQA